MKFREFMPGDLVLWKDVENMKDWNEGKLAPNWKGPYQVTTIARMRAYYLEDIEE